MQYTMADTSHLIDNLRSNKAHLSLSFEQISEFDDYLKDQWNIRPIFMHEDRWQQQLRKIVGRRAVKSFMKFQDRYAETCEVEPSEKADHEFYDRIADQPYLGFVHSDKYSFILDSGAFLWNILVQEHPFSRLLDIGCHAGYHGIWLAKTTGISVVGLDFSRPAIEVANATAQQVGCDARFIVSNTDNIGDLEQFDLISCINSLPRDPLEIMRRLAPIVSMLSNDGLLYCQFYHIERWREHYDEIKKNVHELGLSYGYSDVVGGWGGENKGYAGEIVIIFSKAQGRNLPEQFDELIEEATSMWSSFSDYANSGDFPKEQHCHAYFRCMRWTLQ